VIFRGMKECNIFQRHTGRRLGMFVLVLLLIASLAFFHPNLFAETLDSAAEDVDTSPKVEDISSAPQAEEKTPRVSYTFVFSDIQTLITYASVPGVLYNPTTRTLSFGNGPIYGGNANGNTYLLFQTPGMFSYVDNINFASNVDAAVVLSNIDIIGNIALQEYAEIDFLLNNSNMVTGSVYVPEGAEADFSGNGSLVVSAKNPGSAAIGGSYGQAAGTIKINSGTIEATGGLYNCAIGSGDFSLPSKTTVDISSNATVKAYAGGTFPAINGVSSSQGSAGYLVNATLNQSISITKARVLKVFEKDTKTVLETLSLPAGYRSFAYTTNAVSRVDNVRIYGGDNLHTQLVREVDNSLNIYSVNAFDDYNSHTNTVVGSLPLKVVDASGRYNVVKDEDSIFVGTYHWLSDAVKDCSDGASHTITAMVDDPDLEDRGATAGVSAPAFHYDSGNSGNAPVFPLYVGKDQVITLTSEKDARTITQKSLNRHFKVQGNLTLRNIILEGGAESISGDVTNGGISVLDKAIFTMEKDATIKNCYSFKSGGGVYVEGGDFILKEGEITENTAGIGGGVYVTSGNFTMLDGSINRNHAESTSGNGGGIYLSNSNFTMEDGEIDQNDTNGEISLGGGISGIASRLHINGGTVSNNKSILGGGITVTKGSNLVFSKGEIVSNRASNGGGMYLLGNSTFTMDGGVISGNKAESHGGGVHVVSGKSKFIMNDGLINDNTAYLGGGGIYLGEDATLEVGDVVGSNSVAMPEISNNHTPKGYGGAIKVARYKDIKIAANTVFGKQGSTSANTASDEIDLGLDAAGYSKAFPTIKSTFGQYYSTAANHPVNNFDINLVQHEVSVYCRNEAGAPLDSLPAVQTYQVMDGATFSLDDKGGIPSVEGYVFQGWKANYGNVSIDKNVKVENVASPVKIDLIYQRVTDLTISKTVTGSYGNTTKAFTFSAYFKDLNNKPLKGTYSFTGKVTPGSEALAPASGSLTLNAQGKAEFQLMHGQEIVIENLPLSAQVRIEKSFDSNYTSSFIDSVNASLEPVEGNDTSFLSMEENRTLSFSSERIAVVEAGLPLGNITALLQLPLIVLAVLLPILGAIVLRRLRKTERG